MTYTLKVKQDYLEVVIPKKKERKEKRERTGLIQQKRFIQSLSRTKRNIAEILTYNLEPFHLMITLTYAENYQDYENSRIDFQNFIRALKSPKYLRIQELQKRGAIHYHIILFTNDISEQEVKKAWPYGQIDYQVITDLNINAISNYLAKYATQNEKGQLIHTNKKMFTTSRGLKRPKKIAINLTDIERLKDNNIYVEIEKLGYKKIIIKNS